jgi:heat shock protein HslJ
MQNDKQPDNNNLFKKWTLTGAPLLCSQDMLEEICITFRENGSASVSDTANSTNGRYQIDDKSITIEGNGWTERGRRWNSEQEQREANLVDNFIHELVSQPFNFELKDNMLIVKHNNNLYHFK